LLWLSDTHDKVNKSHGKSCEKSSYRPLSDRNLDQRERKGKERKRKSGEKDNKIKSKWAATAAGSRWHGAILLR